MAVTTDPAELATAAACYCFPQSTAEAVLIYLLAQIAKDESTPDELAEKAKCYCFPDPASRQAVMLYLLAQIAET